MHEAMKVSFRSVLYIYQQKQTTQNQVFIFFYVDKEEAAVRYVEVPTRTVKPTQSCSGCGHQRQKPLSERTHDCPKCKLKLPRDRNAPRCMLNWVLFGTVFDPNSGLERAEVCRASGDAPVQESPAIVVL